MLHDMYHNIIILCMFTADFKIYISVDILDYIQRENIKRTACRTMQRNQQGRAGMRLGGR